MCRAGDLCAFDELVRRHKDRVYNVSYRVLGHREDAWDTAQETFVRAYRGLEGFRGDAEFSTWLHRIALNLARNRLRDEGRRGRGQTVSLDSGSDGKSALSDAPARADARPDAQASARETREHLERCLSEMPSEYREVFVLRVFDERSYNEIAELLECPLGTVKSRLCAARKLLREKLAQQALL